MGSIIVKQKSDFSFEDMNIFFKAYHIFTNPAEKGIIYDTFKKIFFPQFYMISEDKEDIDDIKAMERRIQVNKGISQLKQTNLIEKRVKDLDLRLKNYLCSTSNSVRKAFLALDPDTKGYITCKDIYAAAVPHMEIEYEDLKKLIKDKDKKKTGRLEYADFSSWIGGLMKQSEGFYFRHDS